MIFLIRWLVPSWINMWVSLCHGTGIRLWNYSIWRAVRWNITRLRENWCFLPDPAVLWIPMYSIGRGLCPIRSRMYSFYIFLNRPLSPEIRGAGLRKNMFCRWWRRRRWRLLAFSRSMKGMQGFLGWFRRRFICRSVSVGMRFGSGKRCRGYGFCFLIVFILSRRAAQSWTKTMKGWKRCWFISMIISRINLRWQRLLRRSI